MYSLNWPNIFLNSRLSLLEDKQAAVNNLKLLLGSCKQELFGDPAFGTELKELFFAPNSVWIKDLVIDTIYSAIAKYIPQIRTKRNDIQIEQDKSTMYITISFQYIIDKELDTINIELVEN